MPWIYASQDSPTGSLPWPGSPPGNNSFFFTPSALKVQVGFSFFLHSHFPTVAYGFVPVTSPKFLFSRLQTTNILIAKSNKHYQSVSCLSTGCQCCCSLTQSPGSRVNVQCLFTSWILIHSFIHVLHLMDIHLSSILPCWVASQTCFSFRICCLSVRTHPPMLVWMVRCCLMGKAIGHTWLQNFFTILGALVKIKSLVYFSSEVEVIIPISQRYYEN